jgi:hypothetical protein
LFRTFIPLSTNPSQNNFASAVACAETGKILWSAAACRRFRFYSRSGGDARACGYAEQSAVHRIDFSRLGNGRQNTLLIHMGETECAGQ